MSKKAYPTIYRKTSLGETLQQTLDEMLKQNMIEPDAIN